MKPFVVLASLFAVANAGNIGFNGGGAPGGGYQGNVGGNGGYAGAGGFAGGIGGNFGGGNGVFSGGSGGGFLGGNSGSGFDDGTGFVGGGGGGQIRKFVSVHVGPDEPQITQTKVIRAGGAPDKHVNIIFVKAPSTSSQQNTEVILPEQPQQKTLVYVLVKKQESTSNVRVRGPSPTRPSKPEVYFIRYKDGQVPAGIAPGFGGGDVGLGHAGGNVGITGSNVGLGHGGGNVVLGQGNLGQAYGPPQGANGGY